MTGIPARRACDTVNDIPQPKLVLLVDDDDDIREVTQTSLELVDGFRIITASNGREAVRQAREHHPDGILLDMMMPGVDGLATLEMLNADPATAGIKVILLTARVDGVQQTPTVAGLIPKPFDPMSLGVEVSRMMGWSR